MNDRELIQKLSAKLDELEKRLQEIEDVEAIKKLQRAYGYYLDKRLWEEFTDCFAENGSLELAQRGVYKGKKRIRQLMTLMPEDADGLKYGVVANHMNLQGIVNIDPGGQTAKGRWRAFLQVGILGERAHWGEGVYENTYVKECGVWKLNVVHWYTTFITPYDQGWDKEYEKEFPRVSEDLPPDEPPSEVYEDFPDIYIPAFHYPHPVTGKPFKK